MKISVWVIGGLTLATTLWAGDVWKDKKPADWQEKDVQKFLTKSPWSKTVPMQMDASRLGTMRDMGGGMAGGGGRGGMGGGRGGMGGGMGGGGMGGGMGGEGGGMEGAGGGGGMPDLPPAVVRWESAPLVREANARVESKAFNEAVAGFSKDYYVISVTMAGPQRRGGWQGGPGPQDDPQAEDRHAQMQARMLAATTIRVGSGEPRSPERVEMLKDANGRVMLYLFPRALALENGEKELNFETAMGPMVIKARFNLKDMAQGSIQGL